jgi:uncharacterized protein YjbJ (UPF0337 family)
MNKDQLKGQMKDMGGKAREKAGEITGNNEQRAKGMANQAEGKLQKGYGDVKNAAQNIGKKDNDDNNDKSE